MTNNDQFENCERQGARRAEVGPESARVYGVDEGLRSVAPVIGILLDAEKVRKMLHKEAQNGI